MEIKNKAKKKIGSILIIDDQIEMVNLILMELKRVQCINVYKYFDIIVYTGEYLGFSIIQDIQNNKLPKIDIAILDITLGGIDDGIEYDGIDVSIELDKRDNNTWINYITGHSMNTKISLIFNYVNKFHNYFGSNIDDELQNGRKKYLINKTENRVKIFGQLIENFIKEHPNEFSLS